MSNQLANLDAVLLASARSWLDALGEPFEGLEPLPGDVSPRRYVRVRRVSGDTAILAAYPAEARDGCSRWLASDALLRRAGVRTPRVLDADCKGGWMLLEDLGPATLYEWSHGRPWQEVSPHLAAAAVAAERIACLDPTAVAALNPPLAAARLEAELDQTWELVLSPRGLAGPGRLQGRLRQALADLARSLDEGRLLPCHRDLMARNLLPLPGQEVGVLDHQDLRLGPPFYDLASLLNDTLHPPPEVEDELVAPYLRGPADRLLYRRAAAQRALKIAGTFEAFHRRGHDRHVPLIAPALAAALRHLQALPETAGLASELAPHWRAQLQA